MIAISLICLQSQAILNQKSKNTNQIVDQYIDMNTYNIYYQMDSEHPLKDHSQIKLDCASNQFHTLNFSYTDFTELFESSLEKCLIGFRYAIMKRIDLKKGGIVQVYEGFDLKENRKVAVKLIDCFLIDNSNRKRETKNKLKSYAQAQKAFLSKLKSDHIVKFYDSYESDQLKIIVMEFCDSGSLEDKIDRGEIQSEQKVLELLKQLMKGILVMHQQKIIHRDLKPENIMCHQGIYKIIDFGCSRELKDQSIVSTCVGTPPYMAPQILNRQKATYKAEIWTLGVILYQCITKVNPFIKKNTNLNYEATYEYITEIYGQVIKRINTLPISKSLKGLMVSMLQIDPQNRIDFQQIINHELVSFQKDFIGSLLRKQTVVSAIASSQILFEFSETIQQQQKMKEKQMATVSRVSNREIQQISKIQESLIREEQHRKEEQDRINEQVTRAMWVKENIFDMLQSPQNYEQICKIFSQRNLVELSYLIISRVFIDLSNLLNQIKKSDASFMKNLKQKISKKYLKIKKLFEQLSEKLTQIENKSTSIIRDRFKMTFFHDREKLKRFYLSGVQETSSLSPRFKRSKTDHMSKPGPSRSGFTREQQIQFTFKQYIQQLLELISRKEQYKKLEIVKEYENALCSKEFIFSLRKR